MISQFLPLTLTQEPQRQNQMWNPFVSQECGLAEVSERHPHFLRRPDSLERPLMQPPTVRWVHLWVDMLVSSQGGGWEENAAYVTCWEERCGSSRGFDLQSSFCKEWGFFFSKHGTSLNFRPFTNIFLGGKKHTTKCLSQLLTSTVNHRHKTTAMWLTKELCVCTSCYWKSFSNSHYVICRQTDRRGAYTPLWVLSSQAYNHGHQMTLHLTIFLFWEIILQDLNLPP